MGYGAVVVLSPNDIKEQLSLAYVHAVAARAGFATEHIRVDRDSVDVQIRSRGRLTPTGLLSPMLDVQLKAHALETPSGETFPFDLTIKNYNDLSARCVVPKILVVLLLPIVEEEWVRCSADALVLKRSAYWMSLRDYPAIDDQGKRRVHVPLSQPFDPPAIARLLAMVGEDQALP